MIPRGPSPPPATPSGSHTAGGSLSAHPGAWLAWLAAALLIPALTRNPFYLLLAMAAIGLSFRLLVGDSPAGRAWAGFARFGVLLGLVSVAFNLVFGTPGETRLFTLPELTLPPGEQPWLRLGGAVTLENLILGLISALALIAVISALATFNALVDHGELLRRLPGFLTQSGTVVSIAIAFMPELARSQREIREARALRGHRGRLRDLPALFLALLAEGLEHSLHLAESMEARGFSAPNSGRRGVGSGFAARLAIAGGLGLATAGLVAGFAMPRAWSLTLAFAGFAILGTAVLRLGRGRARTRYRQRQWRRQDSVILASALASAALLLMVRWLLPDAFLYYPYPLASWPPYNPLLGLAPALLALPATLARGAQR